MTLTLFGRLFEIKPVTKKYESVNRFENLLRSEFESKWEELRKLRGSSQRGLFETGLGGELSLSGVRKNSNLIQKADCYGFERDCTTASAHFN